MKTTTSNTWLLLKCALWIKNNPNYDHDTNANTGMIIIIIMIVPTLLLLLLSLLLLLLLLLLCISKFTYVGPTGSICTAQKVHRSCSTAIVYGKVYCAS